MRFVRAISLYFRELLVGRPRVITTLVATMAILVFMGAGSVAWFSYDVTAGLPDKETIRGMGDMAQATTKSTPSLSSKCRERIHPGHNVNGTNGPAGALEWLFVDFSRVNRVEAAYRVKTRLAGRSGDCTTSVELR